MRINYSTGPKQVAVPPVVGLDYSTALQQLQAAGFAVARTDVESDQPAGVVRQPGAERLVDRDEGVDRQPLGLERAADDRRCRTSPARPRRDAKATLKAAGFKVTVTPQDTDVETFDGVVISQDPAGNTPAGSEHGRDAVRRQVRRAAGRHDHTTDHDDDRHDDDSATSP